MNKGILLLTFIALTHLCKAQWPTPSTPVWTGLFQSHLTQRSVSKDIDVNGNIFIASLDPDINGSDIWIQKLDSSGNLLWGFAGIQVLPSTNTQKNPVVLGDNSGGCYLAYFDDNAPFGAFLQHYDASGNPLLAARGRRLTSYSSNTWEEMSMCSDGQSLYCTFTFESPSFIDQVIAQKLDSNLNLLWDTTGVYASPGSGDFRNIDCKPDGNGGLLVLFSRYSNSQNQYIRLQHLDSTGNKLWAGGAGTEVSTGYPNSYGNSLFEKGPDNSYYICWDGGNNALFSGVYMSKVDSSGNKVWGNTPVTVCDTINKQEFPDMAVDANGNAYTTWRDFRGGIGFNCYVQKVTSTGNKAWSVPVAIDTLQQPQYIFPKIGVFNNGVHVYWCGYYNDYLIRKQVLDSNGTKRCAPSGFDVTFPGYTPIIDDYLIPMPQGGMTFILSDAGSGWNSLYLEYDHTSCVLPTAVEEPLVSKGISISPNPVKDVLTIHLPEGYMSERSLMLFDMNGQQLLEKSISGNTTTVQLSMEKFPLGIYLLKIGTENIKLVK